MSDLEKQVKAEVIANMIYTASKILADVNYLLIEHGLNLENYPEYWHDFNEHPLELQNMFVTNFDNIQVYVAEEEY